MSRTSYRWTGIACALMLCGLVCARPAAAQARQGQGRVSGGRFELSGGVGWTGRVDLGETTATLTGNGVPSGSPVTLFDTSSELESGPRFEGRVAWRLTRVFAIEGGLAVTRTHLRTDVTNDFEQAPPTSATSRLTEYAIEAGLVVQIPKLAFAGGRARPFVTGGAGYLRQVHEGATVIDEGQIVFAGGGVTYVLRESARRAFIETIGLRGQARLDVRTGGVEIEADSGARLAPSVTAGVFVRF